MNRVFKFILKRVPIVPQLLLSYGLVLTSFFLNENTSISLWTHFLVFIVFLFLTQLRFMDEVKDFEKDKIANPTRPMPMGLVSVSEVLKCIQLTYVLLGLSNLYLFSISIPAGIWLLITLAWLQLMYKEFFVGDKLSEYPLIYAFTHQIIIVPLVLAISYGLSSDISLMKNIALSLMIFGAFFSYEVGRKLDPKSHEILKTYLFVYGLRKTMALTLVLMLISSFFSSLIDLFSFVSIVSVISLLSYCILFIKPHLFKLTEGIITINLLLIIWIIPIKYWMNS